MFTCYFIFKYKLLSFHVQLQGWLFLIILCMPEDSAFSIVNVFIFIFEYGLSVEVVSFLLSVVFLSL